MSRSQDGGEQERVRRRSLILNRKLGSLAREHDGIAALKLGLVIEFLDWMEAGSVRDKNSSTFTVRKYRGKVMRDYTINDTRKKKVW